MPKTIGAMIMFVMAFMSLLEPKLVFGATDDVPAVGERAPDATLPNQDGEDVQLSDLWADGPIVLYFYPKDHTPGCTTQACSFRDANAELDEAGLTVVGVSMDAVEAHRKFAERRMLPFTLLSDRGGAVAALYGVKGSFLGYPIARRVTFLIGEDGQVLHVWDPADPVNHADRVLAVARELEVI